MEGLHKKIERLRARCTTLEDGLRTLQAAVTDDPHPLLRDDLDTSTESSPSASGAPPPEGPLLTQEDEEFLDAFGMQSVLPRTIQYLTYLLGTLTLGIRGEARFFGQTARSEVCGPSAGPKRSLIVHTLSISYMLDFFPQRITKSTTE